MESHIKEKIDKLIDIYLDHLASESGDAGWLNCSQWEAMMVEIKSTSGDKDMRMIRNAEMIRGTHKLLSMAKTSIKTGVSAKKYRISLLAHRFYEGKVDISGKVMTEAKVSALIGFTVDQYRHNKKQGYKQMETAVRFLENYDRNRRLLCAE